MTAKEGSLVTISDSLPHSFVELNGKAILMEKALDAAGISILYQNAKLKILYAKNLPSSFREKLVTGGDDISLFGQEHGDYLQMLKKDILESGTSSSAEVEIYVDGEPHVYELKIQRISENGEFGILSVISDITETRHREKVLKSLLRELSHRSKNLLAIIQGIATQTARNTPSADVFLTKFRGRLQSLSHSQDLITDSSWRGAYLFELAEKQFAPYWPDTAVDLPISGVNAHLTPNAAVHLGLALHELIVNSATSGAMALGPANIAFHCDVTYHDNKKSMAVSWIETFPHDDDGHEFVDNSFAKTVLERVVPASMNAQATLALEPGHIEYRLIVPETEFEILRKGSM